MDVDELLALRDKVDAAIAAKGPEVEERITELQAVLKTIKGAAKK